MAEQQHMDEWKRDYRQAQRTAMGKTLAGSYDIGQGMDPKSQASMTYRHFGGPEMSAREREQLMLQYTQLASELQQSAQRLQSRGSRTTRAEVGEMDRTYGKLIDLMQGALGPQATVAAKKIGAAQAQRDYHLKTIEAVRASDPTYAALADLEKDQRKNLARLEDLWVDDASQTQFGPELELVLAEIGDPTQFASFTELLGKRLMEGGHLLLDPGQEARDGVIAGASSNLDRLQAGILERYHRKGKKALDAAMDKMSEAQGELAASEREIARHGVGVDAESRELLRVLTQQKIARAKLKTGVMDKLAAGEEVDPAVLQFIEKSTQAVAGPGLTPMEITEGKPEQPYDYMKIALDRLALNPDDRSLSGMRQEMMASDGFAKYMQDKGFQDENFAFNEMMREYNRKRRRTVRSDRLKARQYRIQERGEGIADQMIGTEPVDDYGRAEAARIADTMKEPRRGAEVTFGGRDVADRGRPSIRERIRTRVADRLRGKQEAAGIQPTYKGTLPGLIGEDLELADLPEAETPVEELGEAEQRERAARETLEGIDVEMLDPEAELSEAEQAEITGAPLPEAVQSESRRGEAALKEDLLVESEFIAPADVKFDKALAARDAAERLGAVDVPADPEIPDTEFVGAKEGGEEAIFEAEQREKKKLWGSPEEKPAPKPSPSKMPSEEDIEGIGIDAADVWDFDSRRSIEDIDVGSSSIPEMAENKRRKALWESLQTTGEDAPEEEPEGEEEKVEEADKKTPSVGALLNSNPGISQADGIEPDPPSSVGGPVDPATLERAKAREEARIRALRESASP